HARLAHRWSFNGDLEDSVGGSDAWIANDDAGALGFSSIQEDTYIQIYGGAKGASDYIVLGETLLSNLQSEGVVPVTIELWAPQAAIPTWSRISAVGVDDGQNPSANESLRMTWSQGPDINLDQVSWEPTPSWGPGNAPYVTGTPYHIVMTIEPAVFTNGALT